MPKPNGWRKSLDDRERAAANRRKWHEPRVWLVKCPACGHAGTVFMTQERLREVNLKCSECAKLKLEEVT